MQPTPFTALRVYEEQGRFQRRIETRYTDALPPGEVLVRVAYSALNYKDALSATGNKGVTRHYPHTPGIDAAGWVAASQDSRFAAGMEVVVTSYDLGMNTDGGWGGYIRVPAAWVLPLPPGMDLREAMILGTAGFTAGLALHKLERCGLQPGSGPVVVSGASGGVGSLATAILARAGYEVVASSGKAAARNFLRDLGASQVIDRSDIQDLSSRPLLRSRWTAAIDTVGGTTLSTLLKTTVREGSVAACGLVATANFDITVFPFILNGVNLLGVDSATCDMPTRQHIWQRLATDWRIADPTRLATEVDLHTLDATYIDRILSGETLGRVVVRMGE
ncbi:MAG: YhdH/YhfP family quinone oxidoreductase [Bacteroidia bacterium]